jgi:hypothetical protein
MEDYDQKVKLDGEQIRCYSKKQLDKLYPDGGYHIIGETKKKNKKKIIAQLRVRKTLLDVCNPDQHSGLLYRRAGYVRVAGDDFIVLLEPRWPFLLLFLLLLGLLGLLLSLLLRGPGAPTPVDPDHPLPPEDELSKPLEDDTTEKPAVPQGGGSLSMIYTLDALVHISTGEISIYFKNPNASSHNVALDLIVISGGEEHVIAQSGLVKVGFALEKLEKLEGSAQLTEGIYTGLYRLHCYDPVTGERALVSPEISGVKITVNN